MSGPTGSADAAPRTSSGACGPANPFKIDPPAIARPRVDGGSPRRRSRSARRLTSVPRRPVQVRRLADRPAPLRRRLASPATRRDTFRSGKCAPKLLSGGRIAARRRRIRSARCLKGSPRAASEVRHHADRIGRCRRPLRTPAAPSMCARERLSSSVRLYRRRARPRRLGRPPGGR